MSSSDAKSMNSNFGAQVAVLSTTSYLTIHDPIPPLGHLFTGKSAPPAVAADLLTFCSLGQKEFETCVQYNVLGKPSTAATLRKKRLFTFSEPKVRKILDVEKEYKLQMECLKKRWSMLAKRDQS